MKEKIKAFFIGRQGMDELSKAMFWCSIASFFLAVLLAGFLSGVVSSLLVWISVFLIITCFVRAFSRRLDRREAENAAYLRWLGGKRHELKAAKERHAQKDYRFFKCPGCGTYVRVPKGKGKLHIKCKCGYVLYRKT